MKEYKQAIIIGAAPMGKEQERLLGILKWVGYLPEDEDSEGNGCRGGCNGCQSNCVQKKDVFLAAADGGLNFLIQHHIKPDYWVGDMDSLVSCQGREQASSMVDLETYLSAVKHDIVPVEKDDTDMALAVAKAYEKGYGNMLMFGGCGGRRLSHSFANIQLMCKYEALGCHIRMMAESYQAEILKNGKLEYSPSMRGNVSVLCLSDCATGVVIEGLKYEYNGNLTNQVALGVSNHFVGEAASISVEEGILLLIYESAD